MGGLAEWKSIGERAFYGCRELQGIRLEQVLRIGREAFLGCRSLERSTVRDGLWIGELAFEDTAFLEDRVSGLAVVGSIVVSGDAFFAHLNGCS